LCTIRNYAMQNPAPSEQDILKKCVKGAHQYCIANIAIDAAVNALDNAKVLHTRYADFEDLYDSVRKLIGGIKCIGDLTVYDTALRIGFISDPVVLPREYVYLARGAMDGAVKLFGNNTPLKFREPARMFAPYFGNMSSHFIEDFLCVLKDYICLDGKIGANAKLPPYSPECKCLCAQKIRQGKTNCGGQPGGNEDCCFCTRIRTEEGTLKEEYAEKSNKE